MRTIHEADLNKERDEKKKLEAKLAQLIGDSEQDPDEEESSDPEHPSQAWEERYRELESKYLNLNPMRNSPAIEQYALEKSKNAQRGQADEETEEEKVVRPEGTAGTAFSIQVAMGLAGSESKDAKYKAIIVRADFSRLLPSN